MYLCGFVDYVVEVDDDSVVVVLVDGGWWFGYIDDDVIVYVWIWVLNLIMVGWLFDWGLKFYDW